MNILIAVALWLQQEQAPPPTPFEATVQVVETQVRETPRALSKILATVKEKERVTVLALQERKALVRTSAGVEGWASECAFLETKAYAEQERAAGGSARVHVYAKGFDPETETRLMTEKKLHTQYAMLDKLEALPAYRRDAAALDERLTEFQKAGRLGEFRR